MFKERDRIQKLISDTIVTLCNSGLEFDTELSVEGLLGITLDHKDILLVNINEIIKTQQKGLPVDEYDSLDENPVLVARSTPCRSMPTSTSRSDGDNQTITHDVDHNKDNDLFERRTESEIADVVDDAVSGQESYECLHHPSAGEGTSDAGYKDKNNEHVIVIKEEPDDYDDCSNEQKPPTDNSSTMVVQHHHSTAMFPEFSQDNFPHLSSTEMSSSNNVNASYPPASDSVNFDTVPSLYSDHLKDEPGEVLSQSNSEVMNCWFNASSAADFDVSGSSLASIPNPQHRLWAPKQATSSGIVHTSITEQMLESVCTMPGGRPTAIAVNAQLRKYRCPQCSFTSDKLFNVRRHINKKHTGQPGMAMPQTGDGTGTATATGTITLTGTNAVTNTTALASDIEVLPSPAPSCVSVSLFKCLHCPFTSKKKFNVKRHIRQQHDQQAVTCEGCNRRCRNQYYLQWYHKPKCPSAQLSTTV